MIGTGDVHLASPRYGPIGRLMVAERHEKVGLDTNPTRLQERSQPRSLPSIL